MADYVQLGHLLGIKAIYRGDGGGGVKDNHTVIKKNSGDLNPNLF